ncbi:MAG: trypsin-like serine protease [Clostridiales bacterium]|nr:trypsin-like serine protease [Clostridiales bacterium]
MKNFFNYLLVIVFSLLVVIVYNSFLDPSIVGIEKSSVDGVYDTYIITYSNGKTDSLTIKNGEDAQDITINDLYLATKTALGKGDEYTMLDFINDYLSFTVQEKDEAKAYVGALSTVEVYSEFPMHLDYISHKTSNEMAAGAGVIYKPEGSAENEYYIITNYHVVCDGNSLTENNLATKVTCFLYGSNVEIYETSVSFGGYSYTYGADAINCQLVGGSINYDIAVLKVSNPEKITNSNAKPVTFFEGDAVVGETIVAVGNPGGIGASVTKGIVSLDREERTATASDGITEITFSAIRIDAPINSGNSGGGLFNVNGELLGIVNSKIVDESVEGIAHALPAVMVKRLADNVIENASTTFVNPKKVDLEIVLGIESSKAEYDAQNLSIKIVEEVYVKTIKTTSVCKQLLYVGDVLQTITIGEKTYNLDRDFRLDDLTWLIQENEVIVFEVLRSNNVVSVPVVITADYIKSVA